MKATNRQKTIASVTGVLAAVLLFFCSGLRIPVIDTATDTYFREAITKGGVAYATCRVINASVSIVKESSLQLEPAGVGISLAVGQALDPIDDMTERLSDVLVTAITSLGVQKLAYEISVSLVPPLLSVLLLIFSILYWFGNTGLQSLQKLIVRCALLIAVARFCLPVSSMVNEFLNSHFFDEQIAVASRELSAGSAEIDKLRDLSLPEIDGILGTIENSAAFLKRKSTEFKNALVATVSHMGDTIENLLKLTFLYVGIFLIQVIILPLLSFFLLARIINALFNANMPMVLQHSRSLQKDDISVEKQ